jgi:hypothetical protein
MRGLVLPGDQRRLRDHDRRVRGDKEPGTGLFARRFNEGRFAVLAFDYRRFGESEGLRWQRNALLGSAGAESLQE